MRLWTALHLSLSLPTVTLAGAGIRVVDQDAVATARGESFTATADNPSAVYYNPAGITQLKGAQVRAGVFGVNLFSDYNSPDRRNTRNERKTIYAPNAYLTWTPENAPMSFGLGVYSPYGLSVEYPEGAPFRTTAKSGKIQYVTANPVVAFRVTHELSLGLGATINYADAELRRGIVTDGDEFKFKGAGAAYGFNAGVLWQPVERHSFGVRYHSATTMDLHGHTSVHIPPLPVQTPIGAITLPEISTEEDADGGLVFPQFLTLGYSFRPTPRWNLEIGAEWTDWNRLNDLTVKRAGTDPATVPLNWRSNWFYMAGVTRTWENGWRASVGYIYAEKMVPEETFTATVPDNNRHVFTFGCGWHGKTWNWDVAYQYSHQPERKIEQGTAVDGRYQLDTHALSLSCGVRF